MKSNTDKLEELVKKMYKDEDEGFAALSKLLDKQIHTLKEVRESLIELNKDMEKLVEDLE